MIRHNQFIAAAAEEQAAIAEALRAGLLATRPYSAERLMQLCKLGERMMHTGMRRQDAQRDLTERTWSGVALVDILVPA